MGNHSRNYSTLYGIAKFKQTMKFTIQLTATNTGLDYGIIKQVVFDAPDAISAYDKHSKVLGEYLGKEKRENGFTGCFIGHSLKLTEEGEYSFKITSLQFDRSNHHIFKLDALEWCDENGKIHKGDPRKV